ncbi:LysE family translocator [Piscinibacter gummiphilus]|uniref:Threonine transporter n=1 Tax=Piscinibacter gummiphilus TaxID=946333 RepID=A0A1W6LF53_9BURK|nr:LysE family translocator [Piscinibacter gummiphilus]ARN22869.1 threonine transporter [Piscinibacter gummiphilus]ATU67568.1 LysE family translocator [Piscinibacter gummiphilus]GLS96687.1 threonine transporter [Piscinibacter gummiphilus]
MVDLAALLGIAMTLSVGTMSPGPSFVMVARTAVSASRADGVAAALGMGVGGVLFAIAALLGLNGLLQAVPSLYVALKVAGGAYLAYLGWRIWRGAGTALSMFAEGPVAGVSWRRSFLYGLSTQVSNPKTAIVYASVFAAFMPVAPTLGFDLAVCASVFAIEAGWYGIVAVVLSSARPRGVYLRAKSAIDRLAGGVMVLLGLRLVTSAARP